MDGESMSLQKAMSRLARAESEEDFRDAVCSLKDYLKETEIGSECLWEIERRAYYLANIYSEKDTKEKMEQAKKRIQEYINEVMDVSLEEQQLVKILENFYLFLESLLERDPHKKCGFSKEQLSVLTIKNEYDVQHLLSAYLRPLYPAVRTEVSEDTGYNLVRADIALDVKHIIEIKCTRKGMAQRKLIEEIEADMVHYSAEYLYFFLYDKEKVIENPQAFKDIYEKKVTGKKVHIIIHQPKIL